jgi:hypothetical protein
LKITGVRIRVPSTSSSSSSSTESDTKKDNTKDSSDTKLPSTSSSSSSSSTNDDHSTTTEKEKEKEEIIDCDVVVITMGPWSGRTSSWFPSRSTPSSIIKHASLMGLKAHGITLQPSRPHLITPHALFVELEDDEHEPEVYPRPDGSPHVHYIVLAP